MGDRVGSLAQIAPVASLIAPTYSGNECALSSVNPSEGPTLPNCLGANQEHRGEGHRAQVQPPPHAFLEILREQWVSIRKWRCLQ